VYSTDARQSLGQCLEEFKPCYSNLSEGNTSATLEDAKAFQSLAKSSDSFL